MNGKIVMFFSPVLSMYTFLGLSLFCSFKINTKIKLYIIALHLIIFNKLLWAGVVSSPHSFYWFTCLEVHVTIQEFIFFFSLFLEQ